MSQYRLVLEMPDGAPNLRQRLHEPKSKARVAVQKLINVCHGLIGGALRGKLSLDISETRKQVTLASMSAGDSVVINGVTFTAATAEDQSSNEFSVTGNDAADATSLAKIVNGSTSSAVSGKCRAAATSAVVEIFSIDQEPLTVVSSNSTTAAVADVAIAAASATLTCSAVSAGDSCVINGISFTGVTGSASAESKTFSTSGDDEADAASLAAIINDCRDPLISEVVRASASGAVVTLTCKLEGELGNCISLAGGTSIATGSTATRNSVEYLNGGSGLSGMVSDSDLDYRLGY